MKRATLIRTLWHWHRRLGLVACVILLLLSITGILLNHSSQLGWDRSPISTQWILRSYGFQAPSEYHGIKLDRSYWVISDNQLFLDESPIASCNTPLHSLVAMSDLVAAACREQVMLFTMEGDLLESISVLPEPNLQSMAKLAGSDVLLLQYPGQHYSLDPDSLDVNPVAEVAVEFTSLVPVPQPITEALQQQFRVHDLTWERFFLDVHAGRWFGGWGWVLMDLGALFLLLLAISGVVMYTLRRTR